MTVQGILQCFIVNGSLVLLLVLPFLAAASLLTRKKEWPEVMLLATVTGCSTQAALGLLWSHLVKGSPGGEVLFFFLCCGAMTALVFQLLRRRNFPADRGKGAEESSHAALFFILAAAFIIRSIHPLQTFALGQSDAYTHLHYLNYIVEQGYLANVVYPSGYHWILALPAFCFHIDPYTVARFGGAFFGVGLVLGIYVFLYKLFDCRAAVFGSFCAACFPGMLLLMKTGVGAFANQFGLFLVPCLLYGYSSLVSGKTQPASLVLFVAAALGMAAAVPMMFIHILIILAVDRSIRLFRERKQWFFNTSRLIVFCLPALLLILFHFSQAGAGQRFQTAQVLTDYGARDKVVTAKLIAKVSAAGSDFFASGRDFILLVTHSPYFTLLVDFFSLKRIGFGNLTMNAMAWCLLIMFVACVCLGACRNSAGLRVLGIWGGLTTIQAAIGFLQFSSYQREGWSLLIAVSCLVGVVGSFAYRYVEKYFLARAAALFIASASIFWSVQHPPAHPALQSSAEDLLIRTVRYLDTGTGNKTTALGKLSTLLDPSLPVILVSRKFVGWNNQGELVPNVLSPQSHLDTLLVNGRQGTDNLQFTKTNQYVVLVDKEQKQRAADIASAFAMVSPELVKGVMQQQRAMYRANAFIVSYLDSLDTGKWQVWKVLLSGNLTAYVVHPLVGNGLEQP
jgi:hypothetical protein